MRRDWQEKKTIRIQQLSEIERENILAQRMEEVQRLEDKRNLDQMLRAQRTGDDAVSRAAKRKRSPSLSSLFPGD